MQTTRSRSPSPGGYEPEKGAEQVRIEDSVTHAPIVGLSDEDAAFLRGFSEEKRKKVLRKVSTHIFSHNVVDERKDYERLTGGNVSKYRLTGVSSLSWPSCT
jgi:hypothetical protein